MTDQTLSRPSVAIIGGGFAGASLAIQLLDRAPFPLRLTIIERRAALGRGVAYSTTDPVHLVNGPSEMFSLYEEDPGHFTRWSLERAAETGWCPPPDAPGQGFAPRALFGAYIQSELARAVAAARPGAAFRHLRAEATDLRPLGTGAEITTDQGKLSTDIAVLATGVFPFAGTGAFADHPRYLANPWDGPGLDRLAGAEDLLIIGASLSMVDAVASLEARGYRGRYLAISRHGHLIEPRRDRAEPLDILGPSPLPRTARDLLARVIAARRRLLAKGGDWQTLPAGIRPCLPALWAGAGDAERRRFARHLRALWDVSLHQAAPPSFAALAAARAEGRFAARAARLLALESDGRRFAMRLRARGSGAIEIRTADGVIDCRGHQEHDWRRVDAALPRALLASDLVRPHGTGFGIDATGDGGVIGADGTARHAVRALGHPLRGVAWESSSIPEQRAQATALADRLIADLAPVPLVR